MFSNHLIRNYLEKGKSLRRENSSFAIHVLRGLYMEKRASKGPGFQSFCLEFATHVCSKEFPW